MSLNNDDLSYSKVKIVNNENVIDIILPKIIGRDIGGFELLNDKFDISKGGLGLVYKIRHINSKKLCALKCPKHTKFIDNMGRELDILSKNL
jgi:hypothetical protein